MFTKPHYRPILAANVTPGMRVYSEMLGEAFTVEIVVRKGATLFMREGLFTFSAAARSEVWVETKPRRLA